MIRGFLFDMDGTLVDTHQPNFEAYRRALEDFGVSISYDDFKKTIGHQAQTFLPWLAPGLTEVDYLEIAERKAQYYQELVHLTTKNVRLVKFLDGIREENKTALVTTAKRRNALAVLRHHELLDKFDLIITAEDVAQSKPAPDAYRLALTRLGLTAKEAIAFEDSPAGAEAAEAAGIAVVPIGDFRA